VTDAGTAGCSISGTTLTSTGGGTCSVTVSKAEDTNYNAISSTATTVTIGARAQPDEVLMTSSDVKTYGSALTLGSSGGSGPGVMSYSVVDPGTAVCSVSGNELVSSGDVGGTCTVKATRGADVSYLFRDSAVQTITVANKASQPTLSVTPPTVAYQTSMALSTMGGAGTGEVTFLVTDPGTADCSIVSGRLHSTGNVGTTCKVAAYKATSTNYLLTSSAELSVTVTDKSLQSITFTAPSDRAYAVPVFTLAPLSDSGLAVAVTSATPLVCTVSGLDVSMHLPGSCMLTANQSGDGNYLAALPVARSFEITRAEQTVTWNPLVGVSSASSPATMSTAVGSDGGTVTYSVLNQGTTNCVIADPNLPIVTFNAAGSCTLQAEASATTTHQAGVSVKELVIAPPPVLGSSSSSGSSDSLPLLTVVNVRSLDPIVENGGLRPGADLVTVDGRVTPVRVEANSTSTGLDVIGAGWRIAITSHFPDGAPRPLEPGGVMAITASSRLDVSGSGFDGLAQVRIFLMSRTTHLGSLMTDRSGDFTGSVVVPGDVTLGSDTLQINGFTSDRTVRSVSLGVRVVSAPIPSSLSVGSRVFFPYRSAVLTGKAQRSLKAMIAQIPAGQSVSAVVTGALRSTGASARDKSLANRRAAAVSGFLETHGMSGEVTSMIRRVPVRDRFRDRRVEITVSSAR